MSFLSQVFSSSRSIAAFAEAALCLREVECEVRDELLRLGTRKKTLRFPHLELSPQAYWERNFFSILFVSIFQSIGIERRRVRDYAAILHSVRGIVTATDNILDDESKGAVIVELRAGRVLPNVLSMLMQNALLMERISRVAEDRSQAERSWGALLDALYAIGDEESTEEAAVETVLPPKQLVDEVHRFRGANLLLLAFVVPEINEPDLASQMAHAKAGVFRIGMALQMLDNLSDFEEDIRRRNHNLLRSWLVHGGTDGQGKSLSDAELSKLSQEQLKRPHESFPKATGEVMVLAIELALRGFDSLALAGHPLDRTTARELMAAMFRLRGLPHLWEMYLASSRAVDARAFEPYFELL